MAGVAKYPDSLETTVAPADPIATPAELATYLGAPGIASDAATAALLADMIEAASVRVVGQNGMVGRWFRAVQLKATYDAGSTYDRFMVPGGNVTEGPQVRLVEQDGTTSSDDLTVSEHRLVNGRWTFAADYASGPGRRVEATYSVGGVPVPAPVKQAVLRVAGWLYRSRDPADRAEALDWDGLRDLVAPWRGLNG